MYQFIMLISDNTMRISSCLMLLTRQNEMTFLNKIKMFSNFFLLAVDVTETLKIMKVKHYNLNAILM